MSDDSDDSDDEWGDVGDDLDIDAKLAESMAAKTNVTTDDEKKTGGNDDDDFWKVEPKKPVPAPIKPETTKKETKYLLLGSLEMVTDLG